MALSAHYGEPAIDLTDWQLRIYALLAEEEPASGDQKGQRFRLKKDGRRKETKLAREARRRRGDDSES